MQTLSRTLQRPRLTPFRSGEEAWFWTIAALMARRDGAGAAWLPSGPPRPAEPDDVLNCLDSLYQRRAISLMHARILKTWGERQVAPRRDVPGESHDFRLWQQAMAQLEWGLRGRGIVR